MRSIIIAISLYFVIVLYFELFRYDNMLFKAQLQRVKNINKGGSQEKDLLDLPFHERFIKPVIDKMIKSIAMLLPIKESSQEELREQLSQAGITMTPKDYRAMNIMIMLGMGLAGFALSGGKGYTLGERLIAFIIGLFGGYVYRRFSLETRITNRKKEIEAQLPEVMDILSVSVVAGLSFYQALTHVTQRAKGPLIDEFRIAQREIGLGRPRAVALDNMAKRTDVNNVRSFISAINQADELGISLQSVLTTQSEMIRDSHRQSIEEKAAKIPVKILIPMVLFIFPVIFIVLLGPAVPTIMRSLGGQ
ncbi:MAG TPA: type II secretion system F family protein [Erysipelothrix sp.]